MNVRELIEGLSELDPELEVWHQKDPEGNGFAPLAGWDDDAFLDPEDSDHIYSGEEEDEVDAEDWKTFKQVVVLWPTR